MPEYAAHLAFVLERPLSGEVTPAQALRAVGAVHGALSDGSEVRTGPVALSPLGLDLDLEAVLVEVDGQVVNSGAGAAIPGGPAAALARAAAERSLEPGDVVLAGPLTAPVSADTVSVHFTHLGSLFATSAA